MCSANHSLYMLLEVSRYDHLYIARCRRYKLK